MGTNQPMVVPGQRFGPGAELGAPSFKIADVDALRSQIGAVRAVAPVASKAVTAVYQCHAWSTQMTGTKVHIAPADPTGRLLGAASSITIWPPWSGKGVYPAWLQGARSTIRAQYRAAGHEAKWYRGPHGRGVMITSLRDDLRVLGEIVREHRVFESRHLADAYHVAMSVPPV